MARVRLTCTTVLLIALLPLGNCAQAQRKDATSQALRSRLRAALGTEKLLHQLLDEAVKSGSGPTRSLKLLIDRLGQKQFSSYLELFHTEIEKAPKIEPGAVIQSSKAVQKRRDAILRLGRASYQLRDALPKPKEKVGQVDKKDSDNGNEGKAVKTFDAFLETQEAKLVKTWLARRGLGEIAPAESRVIEALNQIRAANSLPAFRVDDRLMLAAREHTHDMRKHGFFSHVSRLAGRKTYRDRAARYGAKCLSENIGRGESLQFVIKMWLSSGPHKRAILNPRHTTIGVGVAGKKYTTMFGQQQPKRSDSRKDDRNGKGRE